MAASRELNPQAPEYIPLSYYKQTLVTTARTPLHIPEFFYSVQPPFCYLAASKSRLHTTQPPPHNLLPPPLPPAFEPPPSPVVTKSIGAPRRRPRVHSCSGGFSGRPDDRKTGFRSSQNHRHRHHHHQQQPKEPNFGSRSGTNRSWERRGLLKKHEVLPLTVCEGKTTVMIKNIPKQYNRELLLKFLDEHCFSENGKRYELDSSDEDKEDDTVSAFDFLYLPIDFRTGCSRGFAFVNFTEPRAVWKFFQASNMKSWDLFQSPKIREIVCAKIQGKESLMKHFEKATFRCESEEFLPVCFSPPRDGSGQLVEETRIGKRIAA